MSKMIAGRCNASAFVVSVLLGLSAIAVAADEGELWETTSQMSMEGMPMQMPVTRQNVCAARDRQQPPGASNAQPNCQNSNQQTGDGTFTWTVQCTNPDMSGVGEVRYSGNDSYTGTIRFTSADGNMTINLTGTNTGTACANPQ
jgi:Protein of unknown function (DUF3617)